jgi:hypothetical protein
MTDQTPPASRIVTTHQCGDCGFTGDLDALTAHVCGTPPASGDAALTRPQLMDLVWQYRAATTAREAIDLYYRIEAALTPPPPAEPTLDDEPTGKVDPTVIDYNTGWVNGRESGLEEAAQMVRHAALTSFDRARGREKLAAAILAARLAASPEGAPDAD